MYELSLNHTSCKIVAMMMCKQRYWQYCIDIAAGKNSKPTRAGTVVISSWELQPYLVHTLLSTIHYPFPN